MLGRRHGHCDHKNRLWFSPRSIVGQRQRQLGRDRSKDKTCSGCRQRKPLIEYDRSRRSADRRNSRCKRCDKDSRRHSYLKHRARLLQKQRTYISTYRSKHRQASARWRKKNPEFYRDYYRRHRRELLEYGRRYREARRRRLQATQLRILSDLKAA